MMMFSRGIASALLQDLGGHAGADGAAAFADRKPQLLLHRDRRDQLDRHLRVVPRHHHFDAGGEFHRPRHVRRPQVKLRPIPLEKRRVPAPLVLRQHVHFTLKLRVRRDALRLRQHHPPLHLVLLDAPQDPPHVAPPPPLIQPHPEQHHPPPHHPFAHPRPFASSSLSPAFAFSADPRITGMSSPGYSYFDNSSRTSSSTRSNSSASSTRSHLFKKTTIAGTFTGRASKMCSRVCGIG